MKIFKVIQNKLQTHNAVYKIECKYWPRCYIGQARRVLNINIAKRKLPISKLKIIIKLCFNFLLVVLKF